VQTSMLISTLTDEVSLATLYRGLRSMPFGFALTRPLRSRADRRVDRRDD